jgi:hypothetical protein
MSNEIMNLVETLVLAPLVVAISSFLIALLRQQTAKIEGKIKDEKAKRLLEIAEGVVTQAVTSVTQTYVDGLKADGEFTKEAQRAAFEQSKEKIYALLTNETMQAIQDNYGSMEEWIKTKIEETVNKNK